MLMMEAQNIEKSYRDRTIIKFTELQAHQGDRIGIVGLNGAGKTTLMDILSGEQQPDSGMVVHYGKPAVIPQLNEEDGAPAPELESKWQVNELKEATMSGGERTRRKIARALEQNAGILFADEPTSHLDLAGIERLEQELNQYPGTVFLISHDRELLDAVCTKIIEVEDGELHEFSGNYSAYREQKEHQKERAWFEYEEYTKDKKRLQASAEEKTRKIQRMKKAPSSMGNSEARNSKMYTIGKKAKLDRNVKAMKSRIEHLDKKEKPKEQETVQFDIQYFSPVYGKIAIQLERLTKQYGKRTLFKELSCSIKPGMKVALVGKNGAGKSTLLNMIMAGNEGVRVAGSGKIGYFHQDLSVLDDEKSILANVREDSPYPETMIRTVLARLLFKRDDVFKPVGVLSGGERVKVSLVKIFLGDFNILLLDEPTNYLDVFIHEELEAVLEAYPGTILFATHDRRLMNQLADHVLAIEEDQAVFFEGNYAQYLKSKENPKPAGDSKELTLMKLENEIAEVVGRLSIPQKEDSKQELEKRYQGLLNQLREVKNS
ncbi:MAG TPA: ABC-F type ribosomal protection protein [Bacillales bacterium]|nr:ABC-F type ribosomal protection protein [Bacillales bacterium]